MGMGAFWQDCGDGSNFFLMIYSQKNHHMIQMIFFTFAWKHGERSNYLFPYLFSYSIVSWEQEHGDRSILAGAWERGHFLSIFSDDLFSKKIII